MNQNKEGLRILIVEDNALTALHLREILEDAGHQIVAVASTQQKAILAVEKHPTDLAIIDVMLAKQSTGNGIDTAKELLAIQPMPIIYLTANSEPETFQAAKETLPAAYLLKPFRPEELVLHVDLAYHYFQSRVLMQADEPLAGSLLVPVGKGHEKIAFDEVLYIEAGGAYATIVMVDKTNHTVSTNLTQLSQYFNQPNFFRLSRFHLVNLDYVKRIKDEGLVMADGQTVLPLPSANRKELMKKLRVVRTKPIEKK